MGRSSATADGPRDVYVSRNLVNCCTTMRTSCTTNPQQIDAMESKHYGRRACSKQTRHVDRRKCDQNDRLVVINFSKSRV